MKVYAIFKISVIDGEEYFEKAFSTPAFGTGLSDEYIREMLENSSKFLAKGSTTSNVNPIDHPRFADYAAISYHSRKHTWLTPQGSFIIIGDEEALNEATKTALIQNILEPNRPISDVIANPGNFVKWWVPMAAPPVGQESPRPTKKIIYPQEKQVSFFCGIFSAIFCLNPKPQIAGIDYPAPPKADPTRPPSL